MSELPPEKEMRDTIDLARMRRRYEESLSSKPQLPCIHETGPWPVGVKWPRCLKCEIERLRKMLDIQTELVREAYEFVDGEGYVLKSDRLRAALERAYGGIERIALRALGNDYTMKDIVRDCKELREALRPADETPDCPTCRLPLQECVCRPAGETSEPTDVDEKRLKGALTFLLGPCGDETSPSTREPPVDPDSD